MLDIELLKKRKYLQAGIHVPPWYNYELCNHNTFRPSGDVRNCIFSGLLTIYERWNEQLGAQSDSYYLKVWLHDPRFSRSKVCCAIADQIDLVKRSFHKPEIISSFPEQKFKIPENKKNSLTWDECLDEDLVASTDNNESFLSSFLKPSSQKKNKDRKRNTELFNIDGQEFKLDFITRGRVWVGEIRK